MDNNIANLARGLRVFGKRFVRKNWLYRLSPIEAARYGVVFPPHSQNHDKMADAVMEIGLAEAKRKGFTVKE